MDFINNKLIQIIYMIGALLLVLPGFLNQNTKMRILLSNLSIWIVIILILFSIMFFIGII